MKNPFRKRPANAPVYIFPAPGQAQRFARFARQILQSFDIDTFITATIDLVIDISRAERAMIILFDSHGTELYQTARDAQGQNLPQPETEVSHMIIERVKREGRSLYLRNAMEEETLRQSESAARLKILSIICLPLQVDDHSIGVLYLDNRTVIGAFEKATYDTVCRFIDFISLAAFRALERKQLMNQVHALEEELRARYRFDAIVGHHPKMIEVLKIVSQVANADVTVLISGESGTGKELIARALHYNHSLRRNAPFIPINCGAIPETLLESELFGHVKGAFTGASQNKMGWFERGNGGTVFLDEINDMSPALQVKLLRFLQTGEYSRIGSPEIRYCDVRIVAATSQDLKELMEKGSFREDLFYRLNVIELVLPPLRERPSDILLLANHFLKMYGTKYRKDQRCFSLQSEQALMAYQYPGNVRELENIIQRAVVLATDRVIESSHLPDAILQRAGTFTAGTSIRPYRDAKKAILQQFEKEFLENCLRQAHGNISKAAALADMNIKNFYSKMKNCNLDPHDWKAH